MANEVLAGADVLLGVSGPGAVSADAVRTMAPGAIVFAMANPVPEVQPEEVRGDVAIMATGRSDYPNQINNVLAFPGVFKGALEVRARTINEEMKLAAAQAIAAVIPPDELHPDYIIPSVFNRKVAENVAEGVANAAVASGVARRKRGPLESVTPLATMGSMSDYAIVSADDVDDPYAGTSVPGEFRSLTDALAAEQVAATLIRIPPHSDFEQGTGHYHEEQEELYIVTRGTLTMRFGDDVRAVASGSVVRVAAETPRSHRNQGDEPVEMWAVSRKRGESDAVKLDDFWEASREAVQERP